MQAERWKQIEELYQAALAQPAEKRAAFLAQACPDDPQLRGEVQSLLDQQADSFLESGPVPAMRALSAGAKLATSRLWNCSAAAAWTRCPTSTVSRRITMYSMAKQTMTIRIDPDVRGALDSLAAAADRDRTWIVNQALTAYIETQRWQIEHIRQGLREADAGKFASARAVKQVVDRLRRK